jgi:HTH-type transcriptional repressor of NAD biosynthesis genes
VRTHVLDWTGLDPDDSALWAKLTVDTLGAAPDVCYTSEAYGDRWAAHLCCEHRSVDPERLVVPVSGSAIRGDVLRHLDSLAPATRAHFCRRVCVLGAESTGKTTLAGDVAEALETQWVAEYGRTYCEEMHDPQAYVWSTADFERIIEHQHADEDALAGTANRVLICDTDAFTTCVFHQVYLGAPAPPHLRDQVRHYDLYLLTDPATAFEQDATGLRDPSARSAMHAAYETMLASGRKRFINVSGDRASRTAQAVAAVRELLAHAIVLAG